MLPIPNHLKPIFKPIGQNNTQYNAVGQIVCDCGKDDFEIQMVADDSMYKTDRIIGLVEIDDNYFLIIKLQCNNCKKVHLIFDNDYHGWNGFVCGGDAKDMDRPTAKTWSCDQCHTTHHQMVVTIQSQGQEDFIEEAGEAFNSQDWAEAFSWITIKTTCIHCGDTNDEWISYETM